MVSYYVYLIGGSIDGAMKVGVSKNIKKRLTQLQSGSPLPLRLFARVNCTGREHAYELEARMHKEMDYARLHGEFFERVHVLAHFLCLKDRNDENVELFYTNEYAYSLYQNTLEAACYQQPLKDSEREEILCPLN